MSNNEAFFLRDNNIKHKPLISEECVFIIHDDIKLKTICQDFLLINSHCYILPIDLTNDSHNLQ